MTECTRCNKIFPIEDFQGIRKKIVKNCKKCREYLTSKRTLPTPEKRAEYDKKYNAKRPPNKESRRDYYRLRRLRLKELKQSAEPPAISVN